MRGSSPLARGALEDPSLWGTTLGIIPARAGSTTADIMRDAHQRDHPRSRGEHLGFTDYTSDLTGSSPLARGARGPRQAANLSMGIIPARAGSTG